MSVAVAPELHGTPALPPAVLEAAAAAARVDEDVLGYAVEVALSGGADEVAPGWQHHGACVGRATTEFYPGRGAGRSVDALLQTCRSCPVQGACLGAALAQGERQGVWGGTSAASRRRLRKVLRKAGAPGVLGEEAYLAWLDEGADLEPPTEQLQLVKPMRPWDHQRAAVEAIVAELAGGGRCQVAVATASGKTYIGCWSAAALEVDKALVLVPNLALVAQTAEVWGREPRWADARTLAVCSDTGELALEATTEPWRVREHLARPGRAVVFATYHSSQVLVDAGVTFDLVVADEAHHLAGEVDKAFAAVLRGEIPATRTLFMTATPRRFGHNRRHGHHAGVEVVGMDDEASGFGPRVFEFSLSDAVDAGVVADYRVLVAAVERETFERVARHPDLAGVDPHLLAGAVAVVRAMGELRLGSCLSFHTRVERARSFAQLIGPVAEALPALAPPGPGWSGFVHGGASVRIRRRLLGRLVDHRTWGVLANAKALGEGVDLPTLDAVAIVDPKNSETDVLQATGRALRRPSGSGKVGTVLLPVLLTGDAADDDDALAGVDPRSLEVVGGVLRALRAYDGDLGRRLDAARRTAGERSGHAAPGLGQFLQRRAAHTLLRSRVQLWVPGGATGELAGAMALDLVRETTSAWEESFGRLQRWVREHGSARIPQSDPTPMAEGTATSLGAWCSRQRSLAKRGHLAPDRVEKLSALPGWMWDAREEAWWEKFEVLRDYVERHRRIPAKSYEALWRGVDIGQFVNVCRAAVTPHDGGWLYKFPDRVAALESLPGWVWNSKDAEWEASFARLERYVALFGHADPRIGETVDGFDVSRWVSKQRSRIRGTAGHQDRRTGRRRSDASLSPERVARLRALPGWVDHTREAAWEEGFAHLVDAIGQLGRVPSHEHVCDDGYGLGRWIATQRSRWREGRLTKARERRLEAVAGWVWAPGHGPHERFHAQLNTQWRISFEQLAAWAEENGHALPPQKLVLANGFRIGNWVNKQRCARRADRLPAERAVLLESLPGWVWDLTSPGDDAEDEDLVDEDTADDVAIRRLLGLEAS